MLDFLKTDPLDKRQCSASESQDSHGASIMGWLASGSRAAHTSPWELLGQAGGSAGQGSDTRVPASAQAADRKLRPLLAYFFRRNARGQTKWVRESLPEITLFNLAAVLRLYPACSATLPIALITALILFITISVRFTNNHLSNIQGPTKLTRPRHF